MRILIGLALAAALLGQTGPAPNREPEPAPISVDVDVVNVLATVYNRKNGLVSNLEKSDFKVFEDGKPQDIKYFARETDLPLTIGLLIDVSRSQENLIDVERNAASAFFSQVLRKQDEAFLISFGEEAELLQDYTGSARLLTTAMSGLRVSSGVGGIGPGPVPTISQPRGTVLFDAVYLGAAEKLKSEVGRKVLVVITDGVDEGSRVSREKAIEAAQKSNAVIYSIEYYDSRFYGGNGGGISFGGGGAGDLRKMSEETGGRVFRVDRTNTLDKIFTAIQDEMRSQYAIGYTPTNGSKDGGYRKLEIRTADKSLKVQARKGYYAMPAGAQ